MVQIELEYILKVSPKLLYNRLSTASGLAEWFADDVCIKDNIFTFMWEGSEEKAELISRKQLSSVKFKWLDREDDAFFEFRIENHELSNEITLYITDFVDEDEKEEAIILWEAQINNLKNILGI
jgi:uncharacterized protein YndB with AHSA1/START domain